MAAKKGNKTGRQFSKSNQPANRGRKKSRMAEFIAQFNMEDPDRQMTKEDAQKLQRYLYFCSKAELEKMSRNSDLPIAIVAQIKAIITELALGKTDQIDRIYERLFGKATQPMELTGANGTPLIPKEPMSRKDFENLITELTCEKK